MPKLVYSLATVDFLTTIFLLFFWPRLRKASFDSSPLLRFQGVWVRFYGIWANRSLTVGDYPFLCVGVVGRKPDVCGGCPASRR